MSRMVFRTYAKNEASINPYNLIEQVACNAAAASRTYTFELGGEYEGVKATMWLTARVASTALIVTPTVDMGGGDFEHVPSYSISAGLATTTALRWTKVSSVVDQLQCNIDVAGADQLKLVCSSTGGGATDLFNLRAVLIGVR